MILNGIAASGLGMAAQFTELEWVKGQLVDKLDVQPHPGTFNVRLVDREDLDQWSGLRARPGIQIEEPADSSCAAVCYPVLVNDIVRGAILIPGVAGYPSDQVEVVASLPVRRTLGVQDGDPVSLRLLLD